MGPFVRGHVSFWGCRSQFHNCHVILCAAEKVSWRAESSSWAPNEWMKRCEVVCPVKRKSYWVILSTKVPIIWGAHFHDLEGGIFAQFDFNLANELRFPICCSCLAGAMPSGKVTVPSSFRQSCRIKKTCEMLPLTLVGWIALSL